MSEGGALIHSYEHRGLQVQLPSHLEGVDNFVIVTLGKKAHQLTEAQ